jgi:hypothetical protein
MCPHAELCDKLCYKVEDFGTKRLCGGFATILQFYVTALCFCAADLMCDDQREFCAIASIDAWNIVWKEVSKRDSTPAEARVQTR